jgi:hypothetical protein
VGVFGAVASVGIGESGTDLSIGIGASGTDVSIGIGASGADVSIGVEVVIASSDRTRSAGRPSGSARRAISVSAGGSARADRSIDSAGRLGGRRPSGGSSSDDRVTRGRPGVDVVEVGVGSSRARFTGPSVAMS